jgi:hypothetical protein
MANVTQIDTNYLTTLRGQLEEVDGLVEAQLKGIGPRSDPATTNYINPVNDLTLLAGPAGFDAGTVIANALKTAGGSVYDQLEWLDKVLKDMINEITNTINSFHGTESLNNDAVSTLLNDFPNTINDMNTPANSSSSNPNTTPANPNTTSAS